MVEGHILNNKRNQRFHRTSTYSLKTPRGNVRVEALTFPSPNLGQHSQNPASKKDGPATNGDGQWNKEQVGYPHHQERRRGKQVNVPDGRTSEMFQRVQTGTAVVINPILGKRLEKRRIESWVRIFKGKYGQHGTEDQLSSSGHGAKSIHKKQTEKLAVAGHVEGISGILGWSRLEHQLSVCIKQQAIALRYCFRSGWWDFLSRIAVAE